MDVKVDVAGHSIRILNGEYTQENSETEAAREFARQLIAQLSQMKKYAAQEQWKPTTTYATYGPRMSTKR